MPRTAASGRIPLDSERFWYLAFAGSTNGLLYAGFDHTTDDFSFAFWLRTKSVDANLARHYSGSNPGYNSILSAGKVTFQLKKTSGTVFATATTAGRVNDGKWHHIALVNNRNNATEADRKVHVYVDGALAGSSVAITEPLTTSITAATNFLFSNSTSPFQGDVTDLRHYTKALSAAECASLYAGTHVSDSLANWYPCTELEDNNELYHGTTPLIIDNAGSADISRKASGYLGQQFDRLSRAPSDGSVLFRFGRVTDVHHTAGVPKTANLQAAITALNGHSLNAILCGGDMIEGISEAQDATDIGAVNTVLTSALAPRWTCLGNHDHTYIAAGPGASSVSATLQGVDPGQSTANSKSPYWSYDSNGVHFVSLYADTVSATHGFIMGETQLAWLAADLAANADKDVVILSHYRLDQQPPRNPDGTPDTTDSNLYTSGIYSIFWYNGDEIRAILEAAGNVKLVLSGHEHFDHFGEKNGIKYLTQSAVKDGAYYSVLTIHSNWEVSQTGFGNVPTMARR